MTWLELLMLHSWVEHVALTVHFSTQLLTGNLMGHSSEYCILVS